MAPKDKNMLTAIDAYLESLKEVENPKTRKNKIKQTKSGLYRMVSEGRGGPSSLGIPKMTASHVKLARDYFATQPLSGTAELMADFQRGAEILGISKSSQSTYRSFVSQCHQWCGDQGLYQPPHELLCPPMYKRGQGTRQAIKLTDRDYRYKRYRLKAEETSEKLAAELNEIEKYFTDLLYPGRVTQKLKASVAKLYLAKIQRILGYMAHYAAKPVPLEQLSLSSIIPVITPEMLDQLDSREQRQLWQEVCDEVEQRLCKYLQFIQDFSGSSNPGTQADAVSIFKTVYHFLYRNQVQHKSDYKGQPIESLLSRYLDEKLARKKQWQNTQKKTCNERLKFPEPEPDRMGLEILQEDVAEILRQETRPKNQYGTVRFETAIAKSEQLFLMWGLLVYGPARRQEEQRTVRIWLYCPVKRPPDVPADGYYWPLPANHERQLDDERQPCDNYLCRLYRHNGEDYPQGVYILFIASYKTEATGGPQEIVLRNEVFQEGTEEITFYDYIDRWLSGHWSPSLGKSKKHAIYTWWDKRSYGLKGRWVTQGRMSLNPVCDDHHVSDDDDSLTARWGFFFLTCNTGKPFHDSGYSKAFSVPAERLIGKKTTPHTLRYIWATWGIEIGLDDRVLESLAYAMGHSVATLRRLYERCTPEQKRRPIEKRLEQNWFDATPHPSKYEQQLASIQERLKSLSPEQITQLLGRLDRHDECE